MTGCRLVVLALSILHAVPLAAQPLLDAARKSDLEALDALLEAGADPNVKGMVGTALHILALKGSTAGAARLLDAGADVNAWSDQLGTPLLAATSGGGVHGKPDLRRSEIVALLIDAGAEVTRQTKNKDMSALHFATVAGDVASVALLIEAGADIDAVAMPLDQQTNTFETGLGNGPTSALHIAVKDGNTEIVRLLSDAGAAPKPAREVPSNGDVERGRIAFDRQCVACHTRSAQEKKLGGPTQGPTLGGVVGRPVASIDSYGYSDAMVDFGGNWDVDRLYSFILEPKLVVPGTNMTGLMPAEPADVADIVAYLRDEAR